jgi:hypothetical protein
VRGSYPPPEDDWWRSEKGITMCRRCGEDRMTHTVTDGWGVQRYCDVCSHSWIVKSHAEWKTREQAGVPISGSTGD